MNDRFFLKLLLVLFVGLIASEVLVVVLFGLRLELILFCFIVVAALSGIAVVIRLLLRERREIDSVSMRRAMQKRGGIMQDRLREYAVDEEFIGAKTLKRPKGSASAAPVTVSIEERAFLGEASIQKPCTLESYSMERESFDDYIRRSMNGAVEDSEDGFSVELDGAALAQGPGVPPPEFSHDPKSVIESLKRAGGLS